MATAAMIEYEDASPEVREVYDDIMATRNIDWVNNFWKVLAVQPELLRLTWNGVKEVMAPGAVDALINIGEKAGMDEMQLAPWVERGLKAGRTVDELRAELVEMAKE